MTSIFDNDEWLQELTDRPAHAKAVAAATTRPAPDDMLAERRRLRAVRDNPAAAYVEDPS